VEPFRAADVVPGLKTRRLDRLSIWCLVAAHLALEDAMIHPEHEDLSRFAVVLGTGFGCVELTESYLKTVAGSGWSKADPIVFPETLDNSPASHVARILGLRGPNITFSCRGLSGEAAMIHAASLLQSGEADRIAVLAGDTLNRPLYEWYETARALSPSCFAQAPAPAPYSSHSKGFMPGEGVACVVMESGESYAGRGARVYTRYQSGQMKSDPDVAPFAWGECGGLTAELMLGALIDAAPADVQMVVASANGAPGLDAQEAAAIRQVFGSRDGTCVSAPKSLIGEFDGNGVLRLILALSGLGICKGMLGNPDDGRIVTGGEATPQISGKGLRMLLGASTGGSRAALVFSGD
jgi:3-oxoacyl-[acyl-carrier-protein] synthase II